MRISRRTPSRNHRTGAIACLVRLEVIPNTPNFDVYYNAPVPSNDQNSAWRAFVQASPESHLLQSPEWGALKASFGWQVRHVIEGGCGAQVLIRSLPLGLKLAYIPPGPLGDWLPALLPTLDDLCHAEGVFMLKIEPDQPWDKGQESQLSRAGFVPSLQTIQPPRTILVDLDKDEATILSGMKQKTRYNIRLAERKGVLVRPWNDIAGFAAMTLETAERDAFGAHNQAYFQQAYDLFHPSGKCELLVAEVENEPVAALMVFKHGERAWYLFGASRAAHREKMPAYLLQWEAMRWAKAAGCTLYDLWGIPDADEAELEAGFTKRSDGLWGVYRFKRGFGGTVFRTVGAWDRVYKPGLYRLYNLAARIRRPGVA
ncbi:MAG: peptidoglycan bridge formation glycyltransferase FemA/FemB family protein [Anaerolineales bacterium]|nr:MAG: peptidoglycan bridge formation glycyltransferase FemA/FemB family protein [Anaerolineales bacterium]